MVVVNFIVGLLIVAIVVGILYGLGLWSLKRNGDYDKTTGFIEVVYNGVLPLALICVCIALLLLIHLLGMVVVDKLL